MNSVYITKSASFLPNDPVENSQIEDYLGMVGGKPSLVQHLILRNNQIKERYYALDKEHRVTHTSIEMGKIAVEMLCDKETNP
jgi:3-oxoacyl-[acyl-carrier-protein] synthase-3